MVRRLRIGLAVLGSVGLVTSITLMIAEGITYRTREDQGLDPVMAQTWVVVATYAGLWVFAVALVALAATGVVALVRRRRYATGATRA